MLKFATSMLASLTLLSACATAPTVCPNLPEPPAKVPLDGNWQDQMQHFLNGTLPELPNRKQPSPSATGGSTR